jgi:RNA polymerase sigma-70 factor (ECF subfamily)
MQRNTTRGSLLARLADDSDEMAWLEFHRQYAGLITRVAARRGLQPADCEDVVQNVLVRLTKTMPDFRYDPERGRFRGYLKTVVLRVIVDRFRQNRAPASVSTLQEDGAWAAVDPELDRLWEEEWRTHHVDRAMRRIEAEFSERDRLAFAQYAIEGRSADFTAAATGLSIDQVYQAKSRILRRLGELVAEQIEEEG